MEYLKLLDKKTNKEYNVNMCRECNNNSLVKDEGSLLCNNCGLNNGSIINTGEETRYYGSDDGKYTNDPSRTGIPINPYAPKSSLGTIITGHVKSIYGIRTLHLWYCTTDYKEKSFLNATRYMDDVLTTNGVYLPTNVKDKAKLLYKMISSRYIKRGASRKASMAVCFYYACQFNKFKLTKKRLSEMFNIKQSKITYGCKTFHEIIDIEKNKNFIDKISPATYTDLIKEFGEMLKIDKKFLIITSVISKASDELGIISENTPASIAIGCLYFILTYYGEDISKKELSNKCLISEVTICKTYKKLKENISYLNPILDIYVHKYIDIKANAK